MYRVALFIVSFFLSLSGSSSALARKTDSINKKEIVLGVFSNVDRRLDLFKEAKKQRFTVYRFDHNSIVDLKAGLIYKVLVLKDGSWQRRSHAPIPTVVYDYCFYSSPQAHSKRLRARQVRMNLLNHGVPFVVPPDVVDGVRNKIAFATFARRYQLAHPSTFFEVDSDINKMLSEFGQVYLKPIFGNQGSGIIILTQQPSGLIQVSYKVQAHDDETKWLPVVIEVASRQELEQAIVVAKTHLNRKKSRYLAQQGINFLGVDGRQTYFRVMSQRGTDGAYVSGEVVAKIGGNLAQGGVSQRGVEILKHWQSLYGLDLASMQKKMSQVVKETHFALEKEYGQLIGELGMDVGIDQRGEAFVIEANNKPSYLYVHRRSDLDNLSDKDRRYAVKVEKQRERFLLGFVEYLSRIL